MICRRKMCERKINFVMGTLALTCCILSRSDTAVGSQILKERESKERMEAGEKYERRLNSRLMMAQQEHNSGRPYAHPHRHDASDSDESKALLSAPDSTNVRLFKTYGRGRMEINRGDVATVPNALNQKEHAGSQNDQLNVVAHRTRYRMKKNGTEFGRKNQWKACKRMCPPNRKVVAVKGQNFVILPEPCPPNSRWNQLSGPRPGEMIHEGTHFISGTMGPNNKFCQYQYQVLVRSCEPLKPYQNGTRIKCSNSNIWGSNCTVFCGKGRKAEGPTSTECTDDLTWSNPIPKCRSVRTCSMPKIKSKSRIWCQTANLVPTRGDSIPEGSSCRFYKNGKIIAITCKKGIWRGIRKIA